MAYEYHTERLDLGDDHYTVMLTELKRGTQRRMNEISRRFLTGQDGGNPSFEMTESGEGERKAILHGQIEVNLERYDLAAITDLMILAQTTEWSFGDISQEVLDEMPQPMVDEIDQWMKATYPAPLAASGAEISGSVSSPLSRRERRHPKS